MKIDLRKLAHSDTLPFSGTIDLSGKSSMAPSPFKARSFFPAKSPAIWTCSA